MRPALHVVDLGKAFRHRTGQEPRSFRRWVENGFRGASSAERFWALRHVSFDVAPGEMLGVIGRNGAGKSTLLRLLGGVMRPDEGQIETSAPVNGLLELNTGMHPDLTGRENIIVNGVLAGLLRKEVEERVDRIIDFAELAEFIDDPVRTYSSGMRLRLGFAVAVHVDPKILLIDEVLAVGDLAFQQKCLARIEEFRARGCAIVLISHELEQVASRCDRAIWLARGELRGSGEAPDTVEAYIGSMRAETLQRSADPVEGDTGRYGAGEISVAGLEIIDRHGLPATAIDPGEPLTIRVSVKQQDSVGKWHVTVAVAREDGTQLLDMNSDIDGIELPEMTQDRSVEIAVERLDLLPGAYRIDVGLWHPDWEYAYDYYPDAARFVVSGERGREGVLFAPRHWRVDQSEADERARKE